MQLSKALFEYRLRESARARHVRLRVTPRSGLEVVVPQGYNPARIPGMLEQKQAWIRAALERAEADLPALSRRYQQIQTTDYFQSELGQRVREALTSARGGSET